MGKIKNMKTLVIIPAYNESENIIDVVENLKNNHNDYDYVIINDCSTDNTAEICRSRGYNMIDLPTNLGIGGGVQTGYRYALYNNYDIAVQMDGDGQHDPEYLDKLTEPLKNGDFDISIGSRFIEFNGFQSSSMRRIGIRFLSSLIKMCCGAQIRDVTSGFRAVNKKFIEIYAHDYADDFPEPEAIIAAKMYGGKITEVPVIMKERLGGSSSIKSFKSAFYMIKVSLSILLYRITFKGRSK